MSHRSEERWRLPRRNAEGIRQVRKQCKLARARLRLAEDAGLAGAKTLRRAVRDVSRELAPVRDAAVTGHVAQKILGRAGRGRPPTLIRAQRSPAWWSARQKELAEVEHDVATAALRPLSHAEMIHSLRRSFRRARRAARAAKRKPSLAALHEWRKEVILLRDQLAVDGAVLGKHTRPAHARLKKLARRLGKATDCRPLVKALRSSPSSHLAKTVRRELKSGAKRITRRSLRRSRKLWPKIKRELRRSLS